jgi:hypothetical protein
MVHSMMFFKNVKLIFWDDAVLCAVYIKNKSPYHDLGNKNPYEMWYGCIPSMRHLMVFCSTYYALVPKEQRNNLDASIRKCIFSGLSNTSKAYHIYNEVNKIFIHSRDVFFLESSKNDKTVEQQLNHLDIFTHVKTYHKFDNGIQHTEMGVPILDQSLESPFEPPSPLHK